MKTSTDAEALTYCHNKIRQLENQVSSLKVDREILFNACLATLKHFEAYHTEHVMITLLKDVIRKQEQRQKLESV